MRHLVQVLSILAAWAALTCSPEDAGGPRGSAQTSNVVANWAERLTSAHHQADRVLTEKDKLDAAQTLADLALDSARPDQETARMLAQEAAARSAALYLKTNRISAALSLIRSGLEVSPQPSVGRAQLYMVLADCEQSTGNDAASRQALFEALVVNQQLFALELKNP